MWGLVKKRILSEWLPSIFSQRKSVISPHSAVNTRGWREHHWITSSHKKKTNEGFLNKVAIQFPWKLTESTELKSRWYNEHHESLTKTKALSHRWHLLLSQYGSSQQQPKLLKRGSHGTPLHEAPLWAPILFSLIRITVKRGNLFKPDGRITQRCARKRQQEGLSGSAQLTGIIHMLLTDTHLKEKRKREQGGKILNNGLQLQYWQDKNQKAKIMGR